jgi:hypothetical protein
VVAFLAVAAFSNALLIGTLGRVEIHCHLCIRYILWYHTYVAMLDTTVLLRTKLPGTGTVLTVTVNDTLPVHFIIALSILIVLTVMVRF